MQMKGCYMLASNQGVGGSNPSGRTNKNNGLRFLAVCFFVDPAL